MAIMVALAAQAQKKDVTKFLGIPVDGTKSAMIQKLKAKGFTYDQKNDYLKGEFNGRDVRLYVVTNNNKVYRIMVADAVGSSERDIKIRYNNLCYQFGNNEKYKTLNNFSDYIIDDDVNISYEMNVNENNFEAIFFQLSKTDIDTVKVLEWIQNKAIEKYGEDGLENMSEEEANQAILSLSFEYLREKVFHKTVWFVIDESFGMYKILLYYDNKLNQANGEDL